MDRNNIIGLVLIFGLISLFTWWNKPSQEEKLAMEHYRDSVAQVQAYNDSVLMAGNILRQQAQQQQEEVADQTTEVADQDAVAQIKKEQYGLFAGASEGEDISYTLENDVMILTISAKGGRPLSVELKDYQTYDSLPLILFQGAQNNLGFSFFSQNRLINTNEFYFNPVWKDRGFESNTMTVSGEDQQTFAMRLYTDMEGSVNPDQYIEYKYTITGDSYVIDFDISFKGMQDVITTRGNFVDLEWDIDLLQQEQLTENRLNAITTYFKNYQDDVEHLKDNADDEESIPTRLKWVSYKQQFFSSTLIADNYFENGDLKNVTEAEKQNENPRYIKTMTSVIGLPYDPMQDNTVGMSFYFGPNKYNIFNKMDLDLEQQIQLGWGFFLLNWINRFAIIPVFNFLEGFGWNYGIIILVLTILLKLVLLPIAARTYTSSAKMRVLKPEVDEINERYPKKEDAMKKQQATMELYRKAGASPMSGCLPMLLQMPILIAMFRFFPGAIELRQQSFLWAHDLSTYDSILSLPWDIPFYGDHVSLFTLLMTVSTIIYTKINNDMTGQSNQMPGMKTMMYMMPIMFLGFFNNYSAGLSYYYFLANIITFTQMFIFRKLIDEDKVRAKIQMKKKSTKPKKKSGFQKRLEEMAKQQGVQVPKK
ncbi:MAG: membrane protein insertase YidC [Marinilabiliales bacterium]|nr:MAG: membrane protein insertase YidC [Marinilabiliales bacterium]